MSQIVLGKVAFVDKAFMPRRVRTTPSISSSRMIAATSVSRTEQEPP